MSRTAGVLNITDGTTTVDLLGINNGVFYYKNWSSSQAKLKSGVFQSRGITDGRLPTNNQLENVVETIDVSVRGTNANVVIAEIRKLQKLLRQAVDYWIKPSASVVYIEARNPGETSTRYAAIVSGGLGEIGPMFGQPFIQNSDATVIETIGIAIERRAWQDVVPGSYTAIPIQQYQEVPFDSQGDRFGYVDFVSAGAEPSVGESAIGYVYEAGEEEAIWVTNHELIDAQITHIFRYDVSLGTYSSNLADMTDASLDWETGVELFPTPRAVGDYTLFGVSNSSGYVGGALFAAGFSSMIMTLNNSFPHWDYLSNDRYVDWEAYVGGAWVGCTEYLNYHMQSAYGSQPIALLAGADWTAVSINGVTARWIRVSLTATSSTYPRLSKRAPYVPRNSVRIPGQYISGDIKARPIITLTKWAPGSWTGDGVGNSDPDYSFSSHMVFGGIRSVSRGYGFRSCIPAYSSDSDSNYWSYVLPPGELGSAEDLSLYPTNKVLKYTPANQDWKTPWDLLIPYQYYESYVGTYTVFVRFYKSGTTSDYNIRLQGMANTDLYYGATVPLWTMERYAALGVDSQSWVTVQFNNVVLADFGEKKQFSFRISVQATTGTDPLYLHDITLIPTDEWAFSSRAANVGGGYSVQFPSGGIDVDKFDTYGTLVIDAIQQTGELQSKLLSEGVASTFWVSDSWPAAALNPGKDVELFFYSLWNRSTVSNSKKWEANPNDMMSVKIGVVGEFFNFIGE